MLPEAHICHMTSERMRIRIPSKRGDESYFSSLKDHFSGLSGVERLEVNPLTGSLLLFLGEPKENILTQAARSDLFRLVNKEEPKATLSQRALSGLDTLNDRVKSLAGDELDLPSLALLALFGMGTYQILRGNLALPAWYVAFWYAANILFMRPVGGEEAGKQAGGGASY